MNPIEKPCRRRGKFTKEDDKMLLDLIEEYPSADWSVIANHMKNKTARQCRERYKNYLDPNLVRSKWTKAEDKLLLERYKFCGPRWNSIARMFKNRSGDSVRNRYMSLKRKQLKEESLYFDSNEEDLIFSDESDVDMSPPMKNGNKFEDDKSLVSESNSEKVIEIFDDLIDNAILKAYDDLFFTELDDSTFKL